MTDFKSLDMPSIMAHNNEYKTLLNNTLKILQRKIKMLTAMVISRARFVEPYPKV
jgi:hypothetical protein